MPKTPQTYIIYKEVTVNPASIAANTTGSFTATVTGALTDHFVQVQMPSLEDGLVIGNAWVSATDTVKVVLGNVTTGAVDAASQTCKILIR